MSEKGHLEYSFLEEILSIATLELLDIFTQIILEVSY